MLLLYVEAMLQFAWLRIFFLLVLISCCLKQRITELAGVVVSFDPKPIEVRFSYIFCFPSNIGILLKIGEAYILESAWVALEVLEK